MIFSQQQYLKADIRELFSACQQNMTENSLGERLNMSHWEVLAQYMQPFILEASQVLISQGAKDQSLYFMASGGVSVHYEDEIGKIHLAMVNAGSAIGEGSFFSHQPRSASVQASTVCKVWHLNAMRFKELSNRRPEISLTLVMALGALLAKRMLNQRRRISIT